MRAKILTLGLVCFMIYGCTIGGSVPVARQITTAFPIEAAFNEVWQAVIESFAEFQFPIMNMEKDSGLITTDWIDFTGQKNTDYADCGKPVFGLAEGSRNGRFNVFVKRTSANSCEVKVNCMYRQTLVKLNGDFYKNKSCISTGKLEADMFEIVKSKIGK